MNLRGGGSFLQLFILVIKGALGLRCDWLRRDLPRENSSRPSNSKAVEGSRLDGFPCVFVCICLFSADIMRIKEKRAHERLKCGTRHTN